MAEKNTRIVTTNLAVKFFGHSVDGTGLATAARPTQDGHVVVTVALIITFTVHKLITTAVTALYSHNTT